VLNERERVLGVRGRMDLITRLLQMESQAASHQRIIIHKQNRTGHKNSLYLNSLLVKDCF
jgi:hypothetical protein